MVILLVEDEPKISSFIKSGLEHEDYTVEVASDGEQALDKLSVNDYDLVILDIMLPKKNGFEVCQEIRKMKLTCPVLMLTALDLIPDKVRGLDSGADDYLVKPFEFKELLARIRALFRREKNILPQVLSVGDLVLNFSAHEVKRGEKTISLSSKEFRILDFLIRRQGTVCTRTMINEHVWGFNYVQSNAIDVHMTSLRKKIDGEGEKKLIHTIYGRGYKIKA